MDEAPTSLDSKPLVVQRDRSVLLDLHAKGAEACRRGLARFADLLKSPDHLHTYRITPLSLWNAAGVGLDAAAILDFLDIHAIARVPREVRMFVEDILSRTGRVRLIRKEGALLLDIDPDLRSAVLDAPRVREMVAILEDGHVLVPPSHRGEIKQALVKAGFPVDDLAGYTAGDALPFQLRKELRASREPFEARDYQHTSADAFWCGGTERGGSGVIVLPCGAGKTLVGLLVMERYQTQTLVLTSNRTSVAQWIRELTERTTLEPSEIGEYTGEAKEIRPVTVSTYQILTWRKSQSDPFTHFDLFHRNNWGLVIYDEVHLLPAPVFRVTAELQARRRLGLTATLLREDGKEADVYSLVGPCRYDLPWKELERKGHIAEARCVEVRVSLAEELCDRYALADRREQFRIASENEGKIPVIRELIARHAGDRVLVIGLFLRQLHLLKGILGVPLITSKTPHPERDRLYAAFRDGEIPVLLVSKVANFAIDLPDANVAIEVSGTFGSRQEEAQRLGRILRKKKDGGGAVFYAVVTEASRDLEFAAHRQLFLAEQGYPYEVVSGDALVAKSRIGS